MLKIINNQLKNDINMIFSEDIQKYIINDKGELTDEVKRGYIEEIYMGFCDCCYKSPCIKYKDKVKKSKHIADMFIYKRVKYEYIERAYQHYYKRKLKDILNLIPNLYNDVISIIIEY